MESIKPSFDVLLQTGLHRGLYGHKLHRKRRPKTSKGSIHDGADEAGSGGHVRSHNSGKDDAAQSRYSGDRPTRLSAIHGDSGDKRKTSYGRERDGAGRWTTSEFGDVSPTRHGRKTLAETGGADSRVTGAGVNRSLIRPCSILSSDKLARAHTHTHTHTHTAGLIDE